MVWWVCIAYQGERSWPVSIGEKDGVMLMLMDKVVQYTNMGYEVKASANSIRRRITLDLIGESKRRLK